VNFRKAIQGFFMDLRVYYFPLFQGVSSFFEKKKIEPTFGARHIFSVNYRKK